MCSYCAGVNIRLFWEKNRIYPKIGLKGELGFYSKKGSKLGRELGEGEIRVKRVVLTALRAWLAVVIKGESDIDS